MPFVKQRLFRRPSVNDEDRLLRLFWNRAELKREFAKLQRERTRMVDQIRQQDGTIMRAQQRLDQLEGLLSDPERAASVAVFYQLRGVWAYGRRRLIRLARDLTTRQQEREVQREAAKFEEHRQAALAAIDQRLRPLQDQRADLEGELTAVRAQRFERTGFWNYLRRRRLDARQVVLIASRGHLDEQIERYEKARHDKLKEKLTPPEDIGTDGRRVVNLSVIALAQELTLAFFEHDVALKARDASLRQVTEVNYGTLQECREFSRRIEQVLRQVEATNELAARVQRRSDFLRLMVRYRRDCDTVPNPDVLAAIPLHLGDTGEPRAIGPSQIPVNVLTDEYWDLYSALLS
ncbi:MAG: hypothetical protein R3F24_10105 [Gammaproteobacteria bacterium]